MESRSHERRAAANSSWRSRAGGGRWSPWSHGRRASKGVTEGAASGGVPASCWGVELKKNELDWFGGRV
jgi:hypothetical protein